ncbi:MAG: cell division protein ZapE [Gammaproteobacteria bacterium]|nr:cell division protein ZapE [Gammaproteobacteria bacterium]
MTPSESYQIAAQSPDFLPDPAQEQALQQLQALYEALLKAPPRSFLAQISALWKQPAQPVVGLFLWGGVGRGKTFLFDLFYDTLPFENKLRLHFHRFMYRVHEELRQLKNVKDPLDKVAESFAKRTRVLCLDEFQVTDIADAMIMNGLLRGLFKHGVVLVTTANLAPEELYKEGLQRGRFLPAIALLQRHCQQVHLQGSLDYRLQGLHLAQIYFSPLGDAAEAGLLARFQQGVAVERRKRDFVIISERHIPVIRWADGIVWFDFSVLCAQPRATSDYIEIARYFHTVLVSHIPVMDERWDDRAQRFILMVDEFYDRRVKLIVSAEASPSQLYTGRRLLERFERTQSRLEEMQTPLYLAKAHLP